MPETFEFETSSEAWEYMVEESKKDAINIYSIGYSTPRVVTKCTKEEYNPTEEKKREYEKYTKVLPGDLPEYISPITGKPVDGRYARREELKRHGCREVDPSEFKVEYQNQKFIEKHGIKQ